MLSVFGCAKVETYVKDVLKEDVPIDFSWYSNRNIDTKADPDHFVGDVNATGTERHLNSGTSMGVFGYFHPQASGSVAGTWQTGAGAYNAPNLFYNEPVSITENAGTYTYDYAPAPTPTTTPTPVSGPATGWTRFPSLHTTPGTN